MKTHRLSVTRLPSSWAIKNFADICLRLSHQDTRWLSLILRKTSDWTLKEQGYNSALSVLKLSKNYSNERLETACEIALPNIRIPRYKHLKSILASNQDIVYLQKKNGDITVAEAKNSSSGYVRGPEYYGGGHYDK